MAFFKKKKVQIPTGPPQDPKWARSPAGHFYRLIKIKPEALKGQSGVYVVWHAGIKPEWVFVGHDDDLESAFENIIANKEIMDLEIRGGLYASWAIIRREFQAGVVRYLIDNLKPLVQNPNAPAKTETVIPVISPGAQGPTY